MHKTPAKVRIGMRGGASTVLQLDDSEWFKF
jgi:hypothetical protein